MAADYNVVRQQHNSGVDRDTGRVVDGWTIEVRDTVTGTTVPVFVPDDKYSVDNARTLIEATLAEVRAVHALGDRAAAAQG